MTSDVTLPLWVVVVAAVFAFAGLLDRLLIPSARWALRRRANKAIDELNTRLKLQIQPFKMTKQQVLIDRLVHDPEVLNAVAAEAAATGAPQGVVLEKASAMRARSCLRSAPTPISASAPAWRAACPRRSTACALALAMMQALKAVPPDASVVFVINHRSNMDYVLVTYVAATSSALSYAVGEWAQVWGLRGLIRAMGAYFVRRDQFQPALPQSARALRADGDRRRASCRPCFPRAG